MQNIDFSRKIQKPRPSGSTVPEMHTDPVSLKKNNRMYILILVSAIIAFTAGIVAGLQLKSLRAMDENLVRYPDQNSGRASESFSDTSRNDNSIASRDPGSYLIKVGTYTTAESERIAAALSGIQGFSRIAPLPCRNVQETVPGRFLAFRIRISAEQHNVFLGCFSEKEKAQEALRTVKASGIDGVSGAKLFEISDSLR